MNNYLLIILVIVAILLILLNNIIQLKKMETFNTFEFDNLILIPYRNRPEQLDYFKNKTAPLIHKYLPNTLIVICEQPDGKDFNRGKILNVGIKEFYNKSEYTILHDIDIVPKKETLNNLYKNKSYDVIRIFVAHNSSLGGISKIKNNMLIKKMNGFLNNYWGWGVEDRDLYYRAVFKNATISPNYSDRKKFVFLKDDKKKGYNNRVKKLSDQLELLFKGNNKKEKDDYINNNGLSTLDYKLIFKKKISNNVYHIKADI